MKKHIATGLGLIGAAILLCFLSYGAGHDAGWHGYYLRDRDLDTFTEFTVSGWTRDDVLKIVTVQHKAISRETRIRMELAVAQEIFRVDNKDVEQALKEIQRRLEATTPTIKIQ